MNFLAKIADNKVYKTVMPLLYGWGASLVILGALFKILYLPNADLMLMIGMGTEAVIFFFSAFEKAPKEYHWEKAYPQIIEDESDLEDGKTAVQKLNLCDCKLKAELGNVINALGSNQCLQHLDITGNLMGDSGARLLAKALQINTRLRTINLDRNQISLQGYTDITYALNSNYAMRHIPFPTFDLQSAIKTQPERVDAIIHRMQELLQRNSSPQRFRNSAQAFRLTQGFVMSSTQQVLDKVAASAQDNIDSIRKVRPDLESTTDGTLEQVRFHRSLINENSTLKYNCFELIVIYMLFS